MKRRNFWTGGMAALLLAASGAAGDVTILSHGRTINAESYVLYFDGMDALEDSDGDSASAPGAGAWSHSVDAHAVADILYADAGAEQDSLVSTQVLSGYGYADYDLDAYSSMSDAEALAESSYNVQFRVTANQAYDLKVTLAAWNAGWGLTFAYAELWDINTTESYFSQWHEASEETWTTSGTLPPGDYGLTMHAYASGLVHVDTDTGWAWFDFALEVPAPGSAACVLAGGLMLARRRGN
jgi:hypothetical protein